MLNIPLRPKSVTTVTITYDEVSVKSDQIFPTFDVSEMLKNIQF